MVFDRDSAAIGKRGMKPTRTSADEAASPRDLKRFNTGTQAVIVIEMAFRKLDVEATQTSTDRRISLKKLRMGWISANMMKPNIISGETSKAIIAKQPHRILQLMRWI